MTEAKYRELRDRLECAVNGIGNRGMWSAESCRRAAGVADRWHAWLGRVEDDLARHGY